MDILSEKEKEALRETLVQRAEELKIMAHPVRLCMLVKLMLDGPSNVRVLQDCFDIAQPTISQHLGKLKAAGIVSAERNGKEMIYQLSNSSVRTILGAILNDK